MTYNSHLYLGSVLYPVIRERWDIPLSRKRFLYGCVKPDVTSLFVRHPHFWKYSKKFFFKKIGKLSKHRLSAEKKNKKYSEELGVVLHYAADFFTAAHNVTPNKLSEHIDFEARLHQTLLRTVSADSVRSRFRFAEELPGLSGDAGNCVSLLEEISRLHKTYRADMTDATTDINRIVHASILIASALLNAATGDSAAPVRISV
jgi:hypothetical protein